MIKTIGTANRGTWTIQVNTGEWTMGLIVRSYQFSGGGWQVGVVLPCVRFIYTF